LEVWHDNIGKVDEIENNKFYIRKYYKQVLSCLDEVKIYEELDESVLLCYEEHNQFCHRHIVAAWLELLLGVSVWEVISLDDNLEIVDRPSYIKEYLQEIMMEDKKIIFEGGKKLIKRE